MTPYVADPVYLNGQFKPLAEAGISPLDRGFLYGDGVYEVTPVYGGRPFRHREHMTRLRRSLAAIRLPARNLPGVRREWHRRAP